MAARRIACPACQKRLVLQSGQRVGRRVKCPQCGYRFVVSDADSGHVAGANDLGDPSLHVPGEVTISEVNPEDVRIDIDPAVSIRPSIRSERRRRSNGRAGWIAAGAVLLLMVAVGLTLLRRRPVAPSVPSAMANGSTGADSGVHEEVVAPTSAPSSAEGLRPRAGEPIRLFMVPSGARVIVHFRPSRLWSDEPRMSELRASLTQDVVASLDAVVRGVVNRDPTDVDEVLFVWTLGARGTAPQRAAVVRLAREELLSDLIEEFGGEPLDEFAHPKVYLREDRAVLIRDRRTLAFAPRELASELAEWIEAPNDNTSDGILAVLEHTDRERLATIVFEPAEVLRHLETLFPESLRLIARQVTLWFDARAETVAWSVDTADEFSSEVLLRGRSTMSSSSVAEDVTGQLKVLPGQFVDVVRELNPQRTGFRRIIGRFPAMMEVFRRATLTAVGDRLVRFSTVLPPKAGPNLALATVLTWDQSTRFRPGDLARPPAPSPDDGAQPLTLAERLQRPVDAEFNRTPLEEAVEYIGHEIGVDIAIDGDALKDAGYTRNMPQTFNLGRVPASDALLVMMRQYREPGKEMVLVLDEQGQRATILTRKFAEQRGQIPYEFGP